MKSIHNPIPNEFKKVLLLVIFLIQGTYVCSQSVSGKLGKGVTITTVDSTFSLNFSTRFQTLYLGVYDLDLKSYGDILFVRRARLKFSGFVYNPRLRYKLELGQSQRDVGGGNIAQFNNTSQLILDAVLKYNLGRNWDLWFGQTKLPGNRERVISSRDLGYVDRALTNARFNIDRDLGVQLHHEDIIGRGVLREAFALSMGEGRNIVVPNVGRGYSYTFRLEYLPFGKFTDNGDYFYADLSREKKPKLSIGLTLNQNDNASRERGQTGDFMVDEAGNVFPTDLAAVFADLVYKHHGWTILSEYHRKWASSNVIVQTPDESLKFFTGYGLTIQTGYLFQNNFELAGRFTVVAPDDKVYSGVIDEKEYMLGLSKYIYGHALKIQTDIAYRERETSTNFIQYRFQVEISL